MGREGRELKSGLSTDNARKQRAESKIELRKAKRDDALLKRRNLVVTEEDDASALPAAEPTQPGQVPTLAAQVIEFVRSDCPTEHCDAALNAVRQLRRMLSLENKAPIDDVIESGLVPAFIHLLAHPSTTMNFEASWCITNVASGTAQQCRIVVEHGAVQALGPLLASTAMDVQEQAVWALGNIAGDCPAYRDAVLTHIGVTPFLAIIETAAVASQLSPLRNATWALSNLMRGKPSPASQAVTPALPTLVKLLTIEDEELLADTCWAISYLSDSSNTTIDAVFASGCVPGLMQRLGSGVDKVVTPALRALCNMLTGSDEATQAVVDAGILLHLPAILNSTKTRNRKEACWALSNIAAGTPAQVEALMGSQLMPRIIDRLQNDEYEVKKEAMWCVANVLHGYDASPSMHSAARAQHLVQLGCIKPMVAMLDANDVTTQKLVLDALNNLLSAGAELAKNKPGATNAFTIALDEAEGVDKLEGLQEHANHEVYQKAVHILDTFFGEDEQEDENLGPNANANSFVFGMQNDFNRVGAPGPQLAAQFAF